MGILEGKRILVAGVTMNSSIGYEVARLAQQEGATVIVSNFGRALSLTRRAVGRLDPVPPVVELDVTNPEHLAGLADKLREHVDGLDGVVHSIAYANPETALGGKFLTTPWDDVATAVHVSAYSLVDLVNACRPLMGPGSSVVGLTFDATVSKKSIPGVDGLDKIWGQRAALGWDTSDITPTAKGVVGLLSDWFSATTGEVVHVDGGVHSMGA